MRPIIGILSFKYLIKLLKLVLSTILKGKLLEIIKANKLFLYSSLLKRIKLGLLRILKFLK
jgi:hypothetical protein